MQEMGFTIDATTAGSSVRFDPPDSRDKVGNLPSSFPPKLTFDRRLKPITFHKRAQRPFLLGFVANSHMIASLAHPDPTIPPIMLRRFAKRLKGYYGWCEEDFLKSDM